MFPFEKFKNRRKSTYYSSEKFLFLAMSWILIKTPLSLPEFDGDHENMNNFVQNLILEGEISISLFFNLKKTPLIFFYSQQKKGIIILPYNAQTPYTHITRLFIPSLSSAGHPKDFYFCFYSKQLA